MFTLQNIINKKERIISDRLLTSLLDRSTRKGFIALLDQAVVSATNFLTGVIIGRACSKNELGIYFLGLSIVLLLMSAQNAIITSPFTVYSARLKESECAQYFGSTLLHQLFFSLSVIFVFSGAGIYFSLDARLHDIAAVTWTLVIVISLILLREYARRVSFAFLKLEVVLLLDCCVSLVQISGLLVLAHLRFLSASKAYWIIGIACGSTALGWLILNRKDFVLQVSNVVSDFGRNWTLGKWIFAGNLTLLACTQLYPWFLTSFHGTGAAGVFAACWGIVALINPILFGIGNLLGPETAHAYAKGIYELRQLVSKVNIFLAGTTGLFCLIVFIYGSQIVVLAYGNKYEGNGTVVLFLALSVMASAVTRGNDYAIWAMERADVNFKINLIILTLTFTVGLYLTKVSGVFGVGCGLLTGNIAASILRYIVYKRLIVNISGTINDCSL